jgi:hypothetical protein
MSFSPAWKTFSISALANSSPSPEKSSGFSGSTRKSPVGVENWNRQILIE